MHLSHVIFTKLLIDFVNIWLPCFENYYSALFPSSQHTHCSAVDAIFDTSMKISLKRTLPPFSRSYVRNQCTDSIHICVIRRISSRASIGSRGIAYTVLVPEDSNLIHAEKDTPSPSAKDFVVSGILSYLLAAPKTCIEIFFFSAESNGIDENRATRFMISEGSHVRIKNFRKLSAVDN